MIYKQFQDIQLSRLGMGNMRLPVRGGRLAVPCTACLHWLRPVYIPLSPEHCGDGDYG